MFLVSKVIPNIIQNIGMATPVQVSSKPLVMQSSYCSDVFQHQEQSNIDRIKKTCISACSANKEISFLYNSATDTILQTYKGGETSCNINLANTKHLNNLTLYHSHPDIAGNYTPLSFQDFIFLNNNKQIKQVVAYGSQGQETVLTKSKNFKKLSRNELQKLQNSFVKNLYSNASIENKEQIKKLYNYCEKYPKNSDAIKKEIYKLLTNLQKTPEGSNSINSFWKENSSKLGLEYQTNL